MRLFQELSSLFDHFLLTSPHSFRNLTLINSNPFWIENFESEAVTLDGFKTQATHDMDGSLTGKCGVLCVVSGLSVWCSVYMCAYVDVV